MTAIHDYGVPGSLAGWTSAKVTGQKTSDRQAATDQDRAAEKRQTSGTTLPSEETPVLSADVQGTLIANRSEPSLVPSAALIAAADLLALDIVRALDRNHNGTLSKAEIAAVSPVAAWTSDAMDSNGDGQLSVDELAAGMLTGTVSGAL